MLSSFLLAVFIISGLTATPTMTVTPTATPTATPTDTPVPPPPPPPRPTAEPVSEVSEPLPPAAPAPPPVTGGDFAALPLPANTTVVTGGCASDGTCFPYNFYWAPTHDVVLLNEQQRGTNQEKHEFCHAHQHWTINGGAAVPPSDYDLGSWYSTGEGQSFTAAVAGLPFPWVLSATNGLEDFAWTCVNWYVNPERLLDVGGRARYEWAKANLP